MFHPGKVVTVFNNKDKNIDSADGGMQATLEMWDENLITVSVDPHLVAKIKRDDVVLVDYRTPQLNVIKILRGEIGKQTWKRYKEKFEKRRPQNIAIPIPKARPQNEYVG